MNVNEIRNFITQVPIIKKSEKPLGESPFGEQLKNASETQSAQSGKERTAVLSNSEKQYFEQLFPNSAEEIRSYNPYQRGGAKTDVKLGSLVDRKG